MKEVKGQTVGGLFEISLDVARVARFQATRCSILKMLPES